MPYAISNIQFFDEQNGWATSATQTEIFIRKTTNSGLSWDISLSTTSDIFSGSLYFVNNNLGYVVGGNGKIYKYTDNTSSVASLNLTADNYSLQQNYPNPFNPSTKIQFNIPKESAINLSVYNMLGQLVTIIYNGKLKSGTHNFEFDGSNFSSGIYFYKLETDNFVSIKKMTLIK
ncbi:MAG TPA: T9SS type A sorting domain-containing protein [Melioribacteraceae bacterium]|nr:T9SS type A sorting domain-containing protein [Melioribacteraceae bacterium]